MKKNILIIEDEYIIALNVKKILERDNYHVIDIVNNKQDAIKYVNEAHVDLIMLDIMLDGSQDGIDIAHTIKQTNEIPIIYLTAHSDEATLKKAKETEPHGYILKPINNIELLSSVEIALYKAEMDNKVKQEKDMFSKIMDLSPTGITVVEKNGNISYANKHAEQILELNKDTISQRCYNSKEWKITAVDGSPFPDEDMPFVKVMSTKKPVSNIQHNIITKDNTSKTLSIDGAPIFDKNNEVEKVIFNITEVNDDQLVSLFNQVMNNTKNPIIIFNEEGDIVKINKRGLQFYNISKNDLEKKSLKEILPSKYNEIKNRCKKVSKHNASFEFNEEIDSNSHIVSYISMYTPIIFPSGKKLIHSIALNISNKN